MEVSGRILSVLLFMFSWTCNSCGNFPLLDVDTNMRIVLVPHDMPVGTPFYRLKATDSDRNFPLAFEVLGSVGSSLIGIELLGCSETESLCQADVSLKKALDMGRTYEFQLRVSDTSGDFTRVKAAIAATQTSASFPSLLGPNTLTFPEDTAVGTKLTSFVVRKNELNSRMVLLELREPEGRLELRQRLLSNNRTEGSLYLKRKLDYEVEPWFTFQLLAMNAHTNSSVDTRNVLVCGVVVGVEDAQDSPPTFTTFSPVVHIPTNMSKGDLITRVVAEDGDKKNKRLIRYGFITDSNPFVGFFDLDAMSGEIRLKRSVWELREAASPHERIEVTILAEEIVPPAEVPAGLARFRRSGQQATRTLRNITFWINQPTKSTEIYIQFSSSKFVGEIEENAVIGSLVRFNLETNVWVTGSTSLSISMHLENTESSKESKQRSRGQLPFEVIPEEGHRNMTFELRVIRPELLDFEQTKTFKFKVLASSFSGNVTSSAELEVFVRDENDCKPVFVQKEYRVDVPENAGAGSTVVRVEATDCDTLNYGQVSYSLLAASEAFHIDPATGLITVNSPKFLDRETQSEMRFYVIATDGGGEIPPKLQNGSISTAFVRNSAVAMVIVTLVDMNDCPPIFKSSTYKAILTPQLDGLKWPLQITATDADSNSTLNSVIRYSIPQDSRFSIDAVTGEVKVKSLLVSSDTSPYLGSFKVNAYDLGSPSLTAEVTVEVFSEDVLSQDIQFLFPASPEQIRKEEKEIEKMLSSLVGGHAEIQNIDLYQQPKPTKTFRSLKYEQPTNFREILYDVEELAQIETLNKTESEQQKKQTEKTVVTTRVHSPMAGKNRVFDLEALKSFMILEENRIATTTGTTTTEATKTTTPEPVAVKAEGQNMFWILISLIIILLILFLIFFICILCPCCMYNRSRNRDGKIKIHKSKKENREFEIDDTDDQLVASTRKRQVTTVLKNSEDYNPSVNGFPRVREAWSGDQRSDQRPAGGRNPLRQNQQNLTQLQVQRQDSDDWDPRQTKVFHVASHRDLDIEQRNATDRWRFSNQPIGRREKRNKVRDASAEGGSVIYYGENPRNDGYFSDRFSDYGGNYENGMSGKRRFQNFSPARSPPHSLPPAPPSEDYRIRSQRHPHQRFFRTDVGEVLQLDYDGDDGKELLMRRFIQDQRHPRHFQDPNLPIGYARPEIDQSQSQKLHLSTQRHHSDNVAETLQLRNETEHRPKGAVGSRRTVHPSTLEIPELPEEDESPSHRETLKPKHRKHKDGTRSKSHSKSKDRSRSRETEDEGNVSSPRADRNKDRQKDKKISKNSKSPKIGNRKMENPKSPIPALLVVDEDREMSRGRSRGSKRSENHVTSSQSPLLISREVRHEEERVEVGGGGVLLLPDDLDRLLREEDEDSGIGIVGMAHRNKMLEKKSVFTIAYDEMATQNVLRPDTALNNGT